MDKPGCQVPAKFHLVHAADIRKCQIHLSNVHGQVNLHASRSFVSWQHRLTHTYMPRYFQFIVQDIMMVCVYAFALDAALSIITSPEYAAVVHDMVA